MAGFAVHWGWRKNEILSLTWDEIDEAGGVIRLRDNLIHEQELLDADDQLVAYLAQQAHGGPCRTEQCPLGLPHCRDLVQLPVAA